MPIAPQPTRAQQNLQAFGASRTLAAPPADRSGGVKTDTDSERGRTTLTSTRGSAHAYPPQFSDPEFGMLEMTSFPWSDRLDAERDDHAMRAGTIMKPEMGRSIGLS